ncbi:MAG: dihydrolipoyl dehydrogenase [Buchnera aphidicola (Periphyllus lyropictus)]|uniref:dihydrolipoyl dehydrogenase n=1 Tax=Buchnera aphidicola TaxID=9 RepID=UPI001EC457F7|nr:dihydrolipoyl dehydrogenase [Buchnera aphidicola]NIH16650.1 dihydrolipoyl dehydrogenase [Buchnera aphidicola (Periphyllus lyropictus)]USS94560.1 dihydrolipoyl dehydrogenase [Buchnera aphidicola (Periphyllus lyropictus)]
MNKFISTSLVVIGGGPAGYSAAFRASDLGIKTVLIEKNLVLGGVCLNVGCIPSKALLHFSKVLEEYKEFFKLDIFTNKPKFNINKIHSWKKDIILKMNSGLNILAKKRKVKVLHGKASFINKKKIKMLSSNNDSFEINFENAVIASGSSPIKFPCIKSNDKRIWYSTDALNIPFIPNKMLIIGGGVIGLEMATVYSALGSNVDVIENSSSIFPTLDIDVSSFFINSIKNKFNLILNACVENIDFSKKNLCVQIKIKDQLKKFKYDVILISIGRSPNVSSLNLHNIDLNLDRKNFILTDNQCRTNIKNIFSIGDVSGNPMLAHKGIYEGHLAAEVISGKNHYFDTTIIPNICYTDPEVAWVGITEKEAKLKNIEYLVSVFPWSALGRAAVSNSSVGMTKLIYNKTTKKIIGGSVVGRSAGELLGEISLAIEMGCDVTDISLTMHAHPTLYESINSASKIVDRTITDLLNF